MNQSNKKTTLLGLAWSFVEVFSSKIIQVIVTIVMARLLSPLEFGIIGMIMIFIEVSNSFVDSGFSEALIREKESSQKDYSTVFFFNLMMAFLAYALLFVFAPFVSAFFNEPKLIWILRVVGINLIINSLSIIQRTILIKKVDFKTQTKITTLSAVFAGTTAIVIAYKGFGVWSLVANMVLMQFFQAVFLWTFNRWIPSLIFSKESFKKLFSFGYKLLISKLIDTIFNNIYYVIIGKLYSATILGYYTNAKRFSDIVSQSLTSSIQRVTYPVLSNIQDQNERLKAGYQKIMKSTVFVFFPLMIGIAAVSEPLIVLIFGQKWYPSVEYLQLLCFVEMLYPLHAMNLNILKVKGRSDLFLKLEIIKKINIAIVIMLVIFWKGGIVGLLWGMIFCTYVAYFINTYYSAKLINYSIKEQLLDILPAYLLSFIMGGAVYSSKFLFSNNYSVQIVSQILIGIFIYFGMSLLFAVPEAKMANEFITKSIRKK